ncbi:MAG: DUF3592 domain-containing protein [Planctomycetes bacterium]|nr:DUF3592 domain-containing protein [Planctomycetota bacterium]
MATWTRAPIRNTSPKGAVGQIVCLVLGGVLIQFSLAQFATARSAASWPTVDGRLDSWSIATHTSRGRRGRSGSTSYAIAAQYHFKVEGREYKGDRYCMTEDSCWFRSSAEAIYVRNKLGGECEVHYDPADPSKCCLDPSAGSQTWWLFGAGLVLVGLGSMIFLPRAK